MTKEDIKQAFREGEDIKILVCTEAASEGLNLQTCGVLINYDMPWNPMRVEQRIGRIDRIGQVYDVVWILNYFYEETVEAQIYRALSHRINWFEGVVGDLQPILARVRRAIERVVMATREERDELLTQELSEIENSLDQRDSDMLNVYESLESVHPWSGMAPPLTLSELEQYVVKSTHLSHHFFADPKIQAAYQLKGPELSGIAVTFDPAVFDRFPNSVQFLSFGSPLLERLLNNVPDPGDGDHQGILRLSMDDSVPLVAYYALNQQDVPVRLQTLHDLSNVLDTSEDEKLWPDGAYSKARVDFDQLTEAARNKVGRIVHMQLAAYRVMLIEEARRLLARAALLEKAQASQLDELTTIDTASRIVVDEQALHRLSTRGYPFSALVRLVSEDFQRPPIVKVSDEPGISANQIPSGWSRLEQEGRDLLRRWGEIAEQPDSREQASSPVYSRFLPPRPTSREAITSRHLG